MLANAYGTPYYTMRRRGAAMGGLRGLRGLRGVTCDPDSGVCYDDSTGQPAGVLPASQIPADVAALSNTSGGGGSSSFNFGTFAQGIANDFSQIYRTVQPIPAGCTQIQTAAGTSVSCAGQGQSAPSLALPFSKAGMSGLLLPALLIGGLILLVGEHR